MANRLAVYNQQYYLDQVQEWWDQSHHDRKLDDLFVDYTKRALRTLEYESIMTIYDFKKCLYKLGIIRISFKMGEPMYEQLENWRPSDNQVLRHV